MFAPSSAGFGARRYYAPHEYIDTAAVPEGTPLHYDGAGKRARGWRPAVARPPFANLVVRATPPVEVVRRAASVRPVA